MLNNYLNRIRSINLLYFFTNECERGEYRSVVNGVK